MLANILVVVGLILLNGLLAMSELAVVSSRRARLQAMESQGVSGAATALKLNEQPGRFLSTVQIGITLVGVFAGAFSGATLAEPLADYFIARGWREELADDLALASVVATITYLSLIVGELVPKQIALRNPERVAAMVAPPMWLLSRIAAPVVFLLDASSGLVLKLFPRHKGGTGSVTDEEIHALVAEAASSGVVEPEEKTMIAGVMRLADRSVRAIMTTRQDIDWLDLDEPLDLQRQALRSSGHSKLVAARSDIDHFVGLISTKQIVDALIDGATTIDPAAHVQEALVIPDSLDALDAMDKLRDTPMHAAIVVDEFGSFQGLVTVTDVLSAIAGEFHRDDEDPPGMLLRPDGSWLVDGNLPADEMAERLGLRLPAERDYETAAGLVLSLLGRIPRLGETTQIDEWCIEVVDLDGHRVDKLLVRSETPAAEDADG